MTALAKTVIKVSRPILRRNGVVRAGLFGSVARGEASRKSDVDFVVTFAGRKSLLDLVRLKFDLEDCLKRKVDVLTYRSIHPLLRAQIMREQMKVL
jgi:predicted nucleotidyltransferase